MHYFMIVAAGSREPGDVVPGRDEGREPPYVTVLARSLPVSDACEDPDFPEVLTACQVAVLLPLGSVNDGPWADDDGPVCEDGWRIESLSALDPVLGPQSAFLLTAISAAERHLTGEDGPALAYGAAVNAQYCGEGWIADAAANAAAAALDAIGADGFWWRQCFSCQYGPEMLALAARDLIGTVPGWDRAAYDLLSAPWAAALGPIHPDDAQAVA